MAAVGKAAAPAALSAAPGGYPMQPVQIRLAEASDLEAIVDIHREALPQDFFPRLGRAFLRDRVHQKILAVEHSFILLAEVAGSPAGFVCFCRQYGQLRRELASDRLGLAWAVLRGVLRQPGLLTEVLAWRRGYRREPLLDLPPEDTLPQLSFLAVRPSFNRQGLGRTLTLAGLERLFASCGPGVEGCLVKTYPGQAEDFYRRVGFRDAGVEWRGAKKAVVLFYPRP